MIVVFRVDASLEIGSGHVLRCLTLADNISAEGGKCYFISREYPGHLAKLIEDKGYKVFLLPAPSNESVDPEHDVLRHHNWLSVNWREDAEECYSILSTCQVDWLVVDHYALDYRWEKYIRNHARKVMVIDDLADRSHYCELLLDQTYGRKSNSYDKLVPSECRKLIGSKYILLRREFNEYRNTALSRRRNGCFKKLLISLGGGDKNNIASKVLISLPTNLLPKDLEITIVLGWGAQWLKNVKELASRLPWKVEVLESVDNMAELMASHDWAIGAAGSTSWERACLGIPTVMIVIADNQKLLAKNLQQSGVAYLLNFSELDNGQELARGISYLFDHYEDMVLNSESICDGDGVSRVVNFMSQTKSFSKTEVSLRNASHQDCELIYSWQQQPHVRAFSRNKSIPSLSEHKAWFTAKLDDPKTFFYLIEENKIPVGVVRLDPAGVDNQYEVSIYLCSGTEGRAIANQALQLLREFHPQIDILATVLAGNIFSLRLFDRLGYQKIGEESYISIRTNKKA
jgi:UDP-2,4-diacetamido-2,4,6-trideoxy-beta-L-altropyranose hydrolase